MKKRMLFAASVLTAGGFLAACGSNSATDENTEENAAEDTFEEAAEQQGAEDVPAEENAGEETEEPGEENTEDTGGTDEQAGTLTASEEQAYEMYVLPGYELTSEEPNRDALYLTEDSAVFMRIETFTADETDFSTASDTMVQTLEAINEEAELTELEGFEEIDFTDSTAAEIPSAEGKVTGIVFEREGFIVRLTIFDDSSVNATDDFIEMGKTVQAAE